MNRKAYLEILTRELAPLPELERHEILAEQNEHFDVGLSEGRTEEAIAETLGDPMQVAKAYRAQTRIEAASQAQSLGAQGRSLTSAVFALIVLAPFNFFIVLGPFIAMLGILFGGWSAALGIFLGGLGTSLKVFFFIEGQSLTWKLAAGFFVLALSFAGVIWGTLMILATQLCFRATVAYLRWNLRFIEGK